VTVRADLDSVGAMAIFQMRADGIFSWREEDSEAWHGQYDGTVRFWVGFNRTFYRLNRQKCPKSIKIPLYD